MGTFWKSNVQICRVNHNTPTFWGHGGNPFAEWQTAVGYLDKVVCHGPEVLICYGLLCIFVHFSSKMTDWLNAGSFFYLGFYYYLGLSKKDLRGSRFVWFMQLDAVRSWLSEHNSQYAYQPKRVVVDGVTTNHALQTKEMKESGAGWICYKAVKIWHSLLYLELQS